jgi:hypothetical protein
MAIARQSVPTAAWRQAHLSSRRNASVTPPSTSSSSPLAPKPISGPNHHWSAVFGLLRRATAAPTRRRLHGAAPAPPPPQPSATVGSGSNGPDPIQHGSTESIPVSPGVFVREALQFSKIKPWSTLVQKYLQNSPFFQFQPLPFLVFVPAVLTSLFL